jgi:hypothetical protein
MPVIAGGILLTVFMILISLALAWSQIEPSDAARAPDLVRRSSVRAFGRIASLER